MFEDYHLGRVTRFPHACNVLFDLATVLRWPVTVASVVMHSTRGIRCTAYIKQIACQGVNQTIDCEHRSPVVSIRVQSRMSRHKTSNSGSRSKHTVRDYQRHIRPDSGPHTSRIQKPARFPDSQRLGSMRLIMRYRLVGRESGNRVIFTHSQRVTIQHSVTVIALVLCYQ